MKVPHAYTGRTSPSSQGLSYLRPVKGPAAFGAGVASALSSLGANVTGLAERTKERNDKTLRFGALRAESDWETEVDRQLTELKRNTAPGTTNFVDQADALYTTAENDFIQKQVPAELQDEFRTRAAGVRQRIIQDAFGFQYTQQDSFFRAELDNEYTKAKVGVANMPDEMAAYSTRLAETIQATDLPEADKADLARQMQAGLAAIVYGKKVEGIQRDAIAGVGSDEMAATLLRGFEGKLNTARMDTRTSTGANDKYRAGYGSDTVTRADGTVEAVTKDTVVTDEEADLDLARRIPEFRATAVAQVGGQVWQGLGAETQAALTSVAYNYGDLPASVVRAAQSGDREAIAVAVESLDANPDRRKKEAKVIRGGTDSFAEMDQDPLYENLSFEDREAIKHDAGTRVVSQEEERIKQDKATKDAARNALYTSLHDGAGGQTDILVARRSGLLTDIDDVEKAEKILKDREDKLLDSLSIQAMIDQEGRGYNPAKHNDAFNKYIGKQGLERVVGRDQDYVNAAVLPAVQKLQDVPTDLVGQLLGMTRSGDVANMEFGYATLAQIEDVAPDAYGKRVDGDLTRLVDTWRYMDPTANQEERIIALRGGRNPQEVQASRALAEEAQQLIKDGTVENPLVGNGFFGIGDSSAGNWPAARYELEQEWQKAFVANYALTQDKKSAKNAAKAQLARTWGTTEIGGQGKLVLKHPIEKVYPPIKSEQGFWDNAIYGPEDEYDAYEDQIRAAFDLTPDETFQLVSDRQTQQEVELYKAGELDHLPSYGIIKFTEDGRPVPFDLVNDRWWGE